MAALRELAQLLFQQTLADCSVQTAVQNALRMRGRTLTICEESFDLRRFRQMRIFSIGKAAAPMLQAALARLHPGPEIDLQGVLIAPAPILPLPAGFQFFAGGHPLPNPASFAGARAVLDSLAALPPGASEQTLCLFLLSGGASAMMELPLDPAISLTDTATMFRALVGCGATIQEINCVRKHFSAVKGGRLGIAAGHAVCRTLLISDVPAGQADALGSGPTLPDTSTVADCRQILARYDLPRQFPAAIRRFFASSSLPETPKPGQLQAQAHTLLDSSHLTQAAQRRAQALGFFTVLDTCCEESDYREAARSLLARLRELRRLHARVCLLSAGEVRVPLPSDKPAGTGGRNQQFALYAATLLRPRDGEIAILSAGSDGIDGNSPAAGAVVDRQTLGDGRSSSGAALRRQAAAALETFNAYPFLASRGALLTPGPTGNNLRDLRVLMAAETKTP